MAQQTRKRRNTTAKKVKAVEVVEEVVKTVEAVEAVEEAPRKSKYRKISPGTLIIRKPTYLRIKSKQVFEAFPEEVEGAIDNFELIEPTAAKKADEDAETEDE